MDPTTLILLSVAVDAGLEEIAPGNVLRARKLLQPYCNRAGTGAYAADKLSP
jgi:hypothetical protein